VVELVWLFEYNDQSTQISTLVITSMAKWTYTRRKTASKYMLTFTFAYENGSRHIEGDTVGGKGMYS